MQSIDRNFKQCQLHCSNNEEPIGDFTDQAIPPARGASRRATLHNLMRGKSGPKGKTGEKGEPGESCDLSLIAQIQNYFNNLQKEVATFKKSLRPTSCGEIKEIKPESTSGTYQIYIDDSDQKGTTVFCNMQPEQATEITPRSCKEILEADPRASDGVYKVKVSPMKWLDVKCDMQGGGWLYLQNRYDGSESFDRNFEQYSSGFGQLEGEFWTGLRDMNKLTSIGTWVLRFDLELFDGRQFYAEYTDFSVGVAPYFVLSIGEYSGTAKDALRIHNGWSFSTPDRDQDGADKYNCAESYTGAWWFSACYDVNLNGFKYGDHGNDTKSNNWLYLTDSFTPLKSSSMKIRPQ